MSAIEKLRPEQRDVVRSSVQELLDKTPAWRALEPGERQVVADRLANVVAYLADPEAGQGDAGDAAGSGATDGLRPRAEVAAALAAMDAEAAGNATSPAVASAMAEKKTGAEKLADRLAGKQDTAQKGFTASASREGTAAFKEMVGSVDFPKFVSGLIEGVFTSIVDSSIRQMQAYGKLLEAVVKSVDEFATENVSQNQARDYLANRFPDTLRINVQNNQPRLAMKDDASDDAMQRVKTQLGLDGDVDLDDEESEVRLTRKAQLEMAKSRQQQLATMVLLGINRIVVTDGLINAKVVFDMKASDTSTRKATASMYDDLEQQETHHSGGGWFSGDYDDSAKQHSTVVTSALDDTSESKAQVKANLSGEVRVNFKSETFPLEKMASSLQIDSVNERAKK